MQYNVRYQYMTVLALLKQMNSNNCCILMETCEILHRN